MLYYIGYTPPKYFQALYRGLVRGISHRFQLDKLLEKERIPHITLKSPFELDLLASLDSCLNDFSHSQKASSVHIKGVGRFNSSVIYFGVMPSREMLDSFNLLLNSLRRVEGVSWGEHDNPDRRLHMTIAKADELEGKFQDVYDLLNGLSFQYHLPFNNITLFKKDQGRTWIHKTYSLL